MVAQTEAADFSRIGFAGFLSTVVSDYQCVGINPANLGFLPRNDVYRLSNPIEFGISRQKRNWSLSLLEGGVSLHSDALDRAALMNMITQTTSGTFDLEDKIRAATAFADKGIRFSVDLFAVAGAYQSESWGGVAITIRERMAGTFRFNDEAARLAFEGRHYEYFDSVAVNDSGDTVGYSTKPRTFSDLFDSTRLAMTWFREIGASYGVQVFATDNVSVFAGIGVKYLLGYGMIDAFVESGNLNARSSLSPFFGINYGKATSSSFIPGSDFVPVANGWSADLGITLQYKALRLGISVVDVGRLTWDGNVFIARDTILNGMSSTGFSSYNIFEEAPKITGDGNYFKWEGANKASTSLPTRIHLGTSYDYRTNWRFGVDAVIPLNETSGALNQAIVSGGADWRPLVWLRTGIGIGGGGDMGVFIPVSAMFSIFDGLWELGIASRDVITYFGTNRPVLSLVMGVARIRL